MKLRWHWQTILQAPHRLAFFLGIVLLVFQSAWWSVVQWHRLGASWGISYAVSPTVIHSTAMTLGFMPLLFAGFLFTAGPKWLGVRPPMIHRFFTPLGLQCAGWPQAGRWGAICPRRPARLFKNFTQQEREPELWNLQPKARRPFLCGSMATPS